MSIIKNPINKTMRADIPNATIYFYKDSILSHTLKYATQDICGRAIRELVRDGWVWDTTSKRDKEY